ncbi:hypothetical protein KC678_02435 [Candidatus Dojkabacteria bacterium]|uniref:Uncharacterized protein n=1 Tax=Candidatus Dojkabacteria bacterium TaxID=2099670 RepID=A0A955I9E0_9BACT|nr:hypothetical protein [Candidatus Dojkabacteria bacterium]
MLSKLFGRQEGILEKDKGFDFVSSTFYLDLGIEGKVTKSRAKAFLKAQGIVELRERDQIAVVGQPQEMVGADKKYLAAYYGYLGKNEEGEHEYRVFKIVETNREVCGELMKRTMGYDGMDAWVEGDIYVKENAGFNQQES